MAARPRLFQVNAFCGPNAAGNPGAVCLLADGRSSEWMQMVAAQMNLSETGFVQRLTETDFALRWFTPTKEVPLCGHVTLAAAHVLWFEAGWVDKPAITFHTASGVLVAHRAEEGLEIALPANVCTEVITPDWLIQSFDVTPLRVLGGDRKYLVELAAEPDVLRVRPKFELVRSLADRGVILTAPSGDPAYDFVSRYFAGYVGIDEDPVTGSAHCCLIPYWGDKLGKRSLRARQASQRGGELSGQVVGDKVHLTGRARTVLSGWLCV